MRQEGGRCVGQKKSVGAFRLQAAGLGRVLGSIEADVMEQVWAAAGPVAIRTLHAALLPRRPLSFNTVVSVVNHLVDKGLLHREPARRGHVFRAALSRDEFLAQVSRDVSTGLIRDFGDVAVAQFVAALRDENPAALRRLADLAASDEDSRD
jgi:predicted transcriptional regulator